MTIISLPRVASPKRAVGNSRRASRVHVSVAPRDISTSVWRWLRLTSFASRGFMMMLTVVALLTGVSFFMAQTQLNTTKAQSALELAQANFAHSVNQLAEMSAPERIVSLGAVNHLTVPSSVLQIGEVSLSTPLPLPNFRHHVAVLSRSVSGIASVPSTLVSSAPVVRLTSVAATHK
jgi:hypothetical protein